MEYYQFQKGNNENITKYLPKLAIYFSKLLIYFT